jgi:hypothetical protein
MLSAKSQLLHHHWAKDVDTQNGCVRAITGGNAILSRFPLFDRKSYDTPREGGGGVDVATVARATLAGEPTRLISGHFHGVDELIVADEREARRLMDEFAGQVILGADTNGANHLLELEPVRNLRGGLGGADGERQPPAFTFTGCTAEQTEQEWDDLRRGA